MDPANAWLIIRMQPGCLGQGILRDYASCWRRYAQDVIRKGSLSWNNKQVFIQPSSKDHVVFQGAEQFGSVKSQAWVDVVLVAGDGLMGSRSCFLR